MDDSALVSMLNQREEAAISFISQQYGGLCRSLLNNILSDDRDVEECLNTVYLKLWQSIPPAQPENLKAYIAKTARNEGLMKLRSDKRRPKEEALNTEMTSFLPPVESEAEAKELAEAVSRFLKSKPAEKRNIFLRRYWYFDSIEKIARDFGMSVSKVTSMLFRLRNELRKYLEREELI